MESENSPLWFCIGIGVFILLWEAAALVWGSEILLPHPLTVLRRFIALGRNAYFFRSLAGSFLRVTFSLLISIPLGIAAGLASGLDKRIRAVLQPFFTVVSATPVMAVILIAFLWFGSGQTPVFTGFLMVFPVMAANTMEGLRSVDRHLSELFLLYHLPRRDRLRYLYLPSLAPFILGGIRSSMSLCWKVVAAAEVLVQPFAGLGTGMQRAKVNLETPELFAWTAAAIAAAGLMQFILSLVIRLAGPRRYT
jgi:NitT/TauT family transport system permease protein